MTSLTVVCNGVSRGLTTTATEFTFTDAGCVSATAANISLTATNEAGSTMSDTSVSPSEFIILTTLYIHVQENCKCHPGEVL